ncbi:MAG: hypothetical protein R3E89_11700 [Thiolinea sp.]
MGKTMLVKQWLERVNDEVDDLKAARIYAWSFQNQGIITSLPVQRLFSSMMPCIFSIRTKASSILSWKKDNTCQADQH